MGGRLHLLLPALRVCLDVVAIAAAVLLAFFLRWQLKLLAFDETRPLDAGGHALAAVVWVVGLVGALLVNRLYDEDTLFDGGGEISRLLRSVLEAVGLLGIWVFLLHRFEVSRGWFAFVTALSLVFLAGARLGLRRITKAARRGGLLLRPAVLVTKNSRPDGVLAGPEEFELITAFTVDEVLEASAFPGVEGWPARRRPAVVVDEAGIEEDDLWKVVVSAGNSGCPVFLRSPVRPVARDRLTTRVLGRHTMVKVSPPALTGFRAAEKRAFDVVVSAVLIVLLSPLLVLLSLLVLLTSRWPILFGQERVGRGGKTFRMWKFRTMRRDAEEVTGPVWTPQDDPRRTGLGRVLRRFSLDELPQLWNVLRGDMSLVGPRPERPVFVNQFLVEVPWYAYRHRTRPGITGWAQSHGFRGNSSLDPRVEFDNWYIENWTVALDVKVLIRTFGEIVRGRNAY